MSLRNPDGSLNFVCEIPKDTMAKMEVATVSKLFRTCMRISATHNPCAPVARAGPEAAVRARTRLAQEERQSVVPALP